MSPFSWPNTGAAVASRSAATIVRLVMVDLSGERIADVGTSRGPQPDREEGRSRLESDPRDPDHKGRTHPRPVAPQAGRDGPLGTSPGASPKLSRLLRNVGA